MTYSNLHNMIVYIIHLIIGVESSLGHYNWNLRQINQYYYKKISEH